MERYPKKWLAVTYPIAKLILHDLSKKIVNFVNFLIVHNIMLISHIMGVAASGGIVPKRAILLRC